jgi:hypothetical protein
MKKGFQKWICVNHFKQLNQRSIQFILPFYFIK